MSAARRRARGIAIGALGVLACLGVLASTVGLWAARSVFDTDRYVATMTDVIEEPAVTQAVGDFLTDEILTAVDLRGRAEEALPEELDLLAVPIASATRELVAGLVVDVLRSERFQDLWVAANRRAHEVAVAVLRGDDLGPLQVDGDAVRLDLVPVVAAVLREAQALAPDLIAERRIPALEPGTPSEEVLAEVERALGVELEPGFGTVTLFQGDQLGAAQDAVALAQRVLVALVVVTLVALVATVVLARQHRRAAVWLGAGVVLAVALGAAVVGAVERQVVALVEVGTVRDAVQVVLTDIVAELRVATRLVAGVGLVAAVAAYLPGEGRGARWARGDGADVLRVLGVAAAVAVLVLADLTWGGLAALVGALAAGELALRAAARPEPTAG